MAYNRPYSVQEVVEILAASEGRPRPDIADGTGEPGHSFSRHSSERVDKLSRHDADGKTIDQYADSTFLVDRNSLAQVVHDVLNSTAGQAELAKLGGRKSVEIRSQVVRQGSDLDIFVVYRPQIAGDQMSVDWLSAAQGDGCVVDVYVKVYKIPNSPDEGIHIQTAYPKGFLRTQGGAPVRVKPLPGSPDYPGGSRRRPKS